MWPESGGFLKRVATRELMKVSVYTHPEFERQFKRFKKKYHSLLDDFRTFLKEIKDNPLKGDDLGGGVRKIRMSVASKGGGKRGGMRVITYLLHQLNEDNIEVTLLYIYDKSEMSNVSEQFISYLLKSICH